MWVLANKTSLFRQVSLYLPCDLRHPDFSFLQQTSNLYLALDFSRCGLKSCSPPFDCGNYSLQLAMNSCILPFWISRRCCLDRADG